MVSTIKGCTIVDMFIVTVLQCIMTHSFVSLDMFVVCIVRYGVKREHYYKSIGIREFSERLAQDCFNNNFSSDSGTPAKNIPLLDEVNDESTVSTCRSLKFSTSFSPSAAVSNISDLTQSSASHFAEKEEAKMGGRYNRLTRGYCSSKLPNRNRCLQ